MIRSLFIAKTGMDSSQFKLDTISNNLANVSTNGFKRQRAVFEDLMYQVLRQPGSQTSSTTNHPTGLQVGTGAAPVGVDRLFAQGNLTRTENNLDMAINGKGFFRVQLPDGTTGYTRDGAFKLNEQGQVVNSSGYLLDPQITVPANATGISISRTGSVEVTLPGQAQPTNLGNIQISSFINPQGLESIGGNLFLETAASGAPTDGDPGSDGLGQVSQGYIEASNVNVTEELVNLITAQRAYEINSRAVKTSDEMLQRLTQL
jgi:flagellar basal-body rod protein FlgG